jgi:predicted nuclease of restriction endonuclease-like (RecB) superfamily
MILQARAGVARAVDSGLVTLYWHVGRRIQQDILKETRAEYRQRIVYSLSTQLVLEFGRGYSARNLWHMVRFVEAFPDPKIVHALSTQLGWTHFRHIFPLDDSLKRDFYAEMCRIEKWNTRTLEKKIGSMLFERTALSKKPGQLIRQELAALRAEDRLTPDLVFRDPLVLDFLRLHDTYAENDMEAAILREMESFILELGAGFCFVARQKRMQIDDKDYHLDLLFYHRKLQRLVAIDLKLRNFEAADKGQMELYLNWLKRHECEPGEAAPLASSFARGSGRSTSSCWNWKRAASTSQVTGPRCCQRNCWSGNCTTRFGSRGRGWIRGRTDPSRGRLGQRPNGQLMKRLPCACRSRCRCCSRTPNGRRD